MPIGICWNKPVTTRFDDLTETPVGEHEGAPRVCRVDGFARIRLARPEQHNRLDPADIDALQVLLQGWAQDTSLRAVVITGTGAKTFSSGYTLQAIAQDLDDRLQRLLDTLENLPATTLAVLNGSVYGGATDLALCCDIRIGTPGIRMFMPAARFALHYYPGGLRRYVTRLGLTAAKKLFLTAMTIDAPEMLRIGFLTDLVVPDQLHWRTEEYLDALSGVDPATAAQMKRHLNQIAEGAADPAELSQAFGQSLRSPELHARLNQLLGGPAPSNPGIGSAKG